MPLQVPKLETIEEYVESAPAARIYYRVDGHKLTVVAGMLSCKSELKPDELTKWVDWLKEQGAIEVSGYKDVRELFS